MGNLIRDNRPLIHGMMRDYFSDPITYQRSSGAPLQTTASQLRPAGEESVQQGSNLRLFMSLTQCGGSPPVKGDSITKNTIEYKVSDVTADDYDGYQLSLRAK